MEEAVLLFLNPLSLAVIFYLEFFSIYLPCQAHIQDSIQSFREDGFSDSRGNPTRLKRKTQIKG